MPAILFGSISSIADTSELQRQAFNQAFAEHGLAWQWSQDDYRVMLQGSGGRQRIADYAESVGDTVDAQAVHETKSRLFQQSLADSGVTPRPGVVETIRTARDAGEKVALVSGTARANLLALLSALEPAVSKADFDVLLDSTSVDSPKPDKAPYEFALHSLGEQAADCVAIEDNVIGVQSALAAGVKVVAFPNTNTADHDFDGATRQVDHVDHDQLEQILRGA